MAKEVKCKYCKKLKNHWCKAVVDSPDEDLTRECRHFVHKTNADRIRAMSDEELAEEFAKLAGWDREQYKKAKAIGIEKVMLNWLKQPAEVPEGE